MLFLRVQLCVGTSLNRFCNTVGTYNTFSFYILINRHTIPTDCTQSSVMAYMHSCNRSCIHGGKNLVMPAFILLLTLDSCHFPFPAVLKFLFLLCLSMNVTKISPNPESWPPRPEKYPQGIKVLELPRGLLSVLGFHLVTQQVEHSGKSIRKLSISATFLVHIYFQKNPKNWNKEEHECWSTVILGNINLLAPLQLHQNYDGRSTGHEVLATSPRYCNKW